MSCHVRKEQSESLPRIKLALHSRPFPSAPHTLRELATVSNEDFRRGLSRLRAIALDLLDDVHACGDAAKLEHGHFREFAGEMAWISQHAGCGTHHTVLAIEPVGLNGAKEELRAVGVGASVGHGEDAFYCVWISSCAHKSKKVNATKACVSIRRFQTNSTHQGQCA